MLQLIAVFIGDVNLAMTLFTFLKSKMLNVKYFSQQFPSVVAWVDYERDLHTFTQRRLMHPPTLLFLIFKLLAPDKSING